MPNEVEIKFAVPDLKRIRRQLKSQHFREITPRTNEMNTLYDLPSQTLKKRGWPVVAYDLGDIPQKEGPAKLANVQGLIKYRYAMQAMEMAMDDFSPANTARAIGKHGWAGQMTPLVMMNNIRSPNFPKVPLLTEVGYNGPPSRSWYGIFAPAGTPAELVNHYNDVIVKAIRTPELRERMKSLELEPREMSAAEFQAFVKADTERWAPIIKASGFTPAAE